MDTFMASMLSQHPNISFRRLDYLKRQLEARTYRKTKHIPLRREEIEDLCEVTVVCEAFLRAAGMTGKETAERVPVPEEHDKMDEDTTTYTTTSNGSLSASIGTSNPSASISDITRTNATSKTAGSTASNSNRPIAAPAGRLGSMEAQRTLAAAKADEAARKPVLTRKLPSNLAVPAPRHLSARNQTAPTTLSPVNSAQAQREFTASKASKGNDAFVQPSTQGLLTTQAVGEAPPTMLPSAQPQDSTSSPQQRATAGDGVSQTPTTLSPSPNSASQQTKTSLPQWGGISNRFFAGINATQASATPSKPQLQPPPLQYQGLVASCFAPKDGEAVESAEPAKSTTSRQVQVLRALEGLPEPGNSMLTRSKPKKAPRCVSDSSRRSSPESSPSVPVQAASWVVDHRAQPIKPIAYLLPEDPEDLEKNKVVIINKSGLAGEGPLRITPGSKMKQARKPSGVSKKPAQKMGKHPAKAPRAIITIVQDPDENHEMTDVSESDLIDDSEPDSMVGVVATPSPPSSPPASPPSSPEPEDVDMSN